eukprot:3607528-Prymnesium_polylepis.3
MMRKTFISLTCSLVSHVTHLTLRIILSTRHLVYVYEEFSISAVHERSASCAPKLILQMVAS